MNEYTVHIEHLCYMPTTILVEAFKDRDVVIIPEKINDDHYDVVITHVGAVTMTPLMMWILHHIPKDQYYRIEII